MYSTCICICVCICDMHMHMCYYYYIKGLNFIMDTLVFMHVYVQSVLKYSFQS